MNLELHREGECVKVALFGAIGVAQASELYQRLMEALPQEDVALEIDASQVERLDTSILQVFAFFASRTRRVEVREASLAWEDTARTLGLHFLLRRDSASGKCHGNENDSVGR